jgi:hypothetical protein
MFFKLGIILFTAFNHLPITRGQSKSKYVIIKPKINKI